MIEHEQKTHMCTASGEPIHYWTPWKTKVKFSDLFIALGNQRRYAGAIDVTILQHLALCVELARAAGYSELEIAYVAAHDLHEAYVLDLPTSLKEVLGETYRELEAWWEAHVHREIGLEWPPPEGMAERVKAVDIRALVVEMVMRCHPQAQDVVGQYGYPYPSEAERGFGADVLRSYPFQLRLTIRSVLDRAFPKEVRA